MPLATATTTMLLLLLLSRPSSTSSSARLSSRWIRPRRLCPIRIQSGEDPHVSLTSTTSTSASAAACKPQLLPWKQRHRRGKVHEM